nr:hypothetical protein [Tanacetum cinerariifolium]
LTIRSSGVSSRKKLTGPNFIDWYRQLRIVLSIEDKLNYLEQLIPSALVVHAVQHVAPEILVAHTAWIKGSKEIVGLMLITMEPDIQRNMKTLHAHEMLLELKTLFAQQYYNMHSLGKIINELHAMLKLYEQTLPKNNAPALHAIRAASRAGGSGIFVIELYTILNRSWIYDTGCGRHICNTTQGLRASRKLKPGALSLYVGNGQREAVEAIGIFYLCLSSGLEIVLNNCHYAPSITRGVIFVSRLYEDGFINRFVNNTIQVSRNNMVYFSAIPKDGIFEIDLPNSYTNESSTYAVSNKRAKLDLDSALLWHCRLVRISKKCIKKLQHDGFLDSTDLRAFKKCVSCMFGKMARKPYTHQVERVKDLLVLIHTDVCGPFKIMSRQGASYFVTFTDDCSHYGYVYLLKHKHEVFETFKVFQKEVENQLGKTIKSPRSDRGGEYMSQEFLDHLNDHGIIAHRTPPYTPHHNEDLEIIQEEDTYPSIDTRLNHEEDDLEIDEPQSDIVPIRRSTRTRYAPDRMCLYIDAEEHVLGDLGEPTNYKGALLDPDKWLFKKKTDMDGVIHTYKAHLVAKGYTQTPGIDYEETFSPVADIRAIRILIAIAAYYDYEIWQMDVKTTFLNGYLNEKVYMEQHEGFINPKYPNRVCKLKHSIYGLKQASRQWNKRFNDEIKKFGFTQNRDEPCVYLKAGGSNIILQILYVDDILIMGNNILMLQSVKSYLGRCFAMKDLGEAVYILGIKIYKDRSRRLISLCQSAYIKKILKRYCMENSNRGSIPMQEKLKLSKSQGTSTPAEVKHMQNVSYSSAVVSIIGDLKGELRVSYYTDAGYLMDADDLKSQTGYVFALNSGAIDWKSAKQSIFGTSSAEAEYIATFDASKEAIWVRKVISGLGVIPTIKEPISMYCDNTGAIAIAN